MTERIDYKRFPVLYVDDERANLLVFKHSFAEDFTILTAQSGEEALRILAETPVSVLVTDQRMPGMTGVELAERVTAERPEIVRMILTAYSDVGAAVDSINRGRVWRYLTKPWRADDLGGMLRAAIEIFHMAATIEDLQLRMMQSERLALVGFLAAGVAHDLKSPLACLMSNLETMDRDVGFVERLGRVAPEAVPVSQEMRDILNDCREETGRITEFVSSMRAMATGQAPRREVVDLASLCRSTARLCKTEVLRRARLHIDAPEVGPFVMGDPPQLGQVILNFLVNAAQAITTGPMSSNEVRLRLWQDDDRAHVTVSDTGKGIPPENFEKIFRPFFTTKGDRGGTGLGLAIVKQIVTAHGGEVRVESPPGSGAILTASLPKVLDLV